MELAGIIVALFVLEEGRAPRRATARWSQVGQVRRLIIAKKMRAASETLSGPLLWVPHVLRRPSRLAEVEQLECGELVVWRLIDFHILPLKRDNLALGRDMTFAVGS